MITELNTTTLNLEKGILLTFNVPTSLSKHQEYICYFDSPMTIPDGIIKTINFDPSSYVISGTNTSSASVFLKSTLSHQINTKILIRFVIKDTSNIVVHTDYKLIRCSTSATVTINGKILVDSGGNYGPNGGRIFAMSTLNQLAPSLVTQGDILSGGGSTTTIPDTLTVSIGSNIDPFTFELDVTPSTDVPKGSINIPRLNDNEYVGPFTITKAACGGAILHSYPEYTILDQYNNWTYKINNKTLARFIPDDPYEAYDLIIMLPLKDFSSLNEAQPQPIPMVSFVKLLGSAGFPPIPVTNI